MGTDRMGRDFAVRIMMGTRVSLSVGLIASVLVLIIGATYGAVSAFAGGWAIANLFGLGNYGVYGLQVLFFLLGLLVMAQFVRGGIRVEPFTARD